MVNRCGSDIHHRRSIRLKGYDYSQAGAYFVTLCTYNRECLFGEIDGCAMVLNEFGGMVRDEWLKSANIRAEMQLGKYVIMPNHFHAIVVLTGRGGTGMRRGTARRAPTGHGVPTTEAFGKPVAGSIPTIVRAFKSAVTKRINEFRNTHGVPVWQRNYYEHVIRDEADYFRIAEYVADNPRRWSEDSLNPAVVDAVSNRAS